MQPSNETVPDSLIDKFRLKYSVMTNPLAGGCLATPIADTHDRLMHYKLDQVDHLTIVSMINLLLDRLDSDKILLEDCNDDVKELSQRNHALQQKVTATEEKVRKLMKRVLDLQAEVDQLKETSVKPVESHSSVDNEEQTTDAAQKTIDHLTLFIKVLIGVYPEIDIFYVRNIISQLLQ